MRTKIIENTRHADIEVRRVAYRHSFRYGWASFAQALSAMREKPADLREEGLCYALRFDSPRTREFIAPAIADPDPKLRQAGYIALTKLGNPLRAQALALAGLKDEDPIARAIAAYALWANGGADKWRPELEPLLSEKDLPRWVARQVLLSARDYTQFDKYLQYFADDPSWFMYLSDARAVPLLLEYQQNIVRKLTDNGSLESVNNALIKLGPPAADAALKLIDLPRADDSKEWAINDQAFSILHKMHDPRLPAKLEEMMRGPAGELRDRSCRYICESGDARLQAELLSEMKQPGDNGRWIEFQLLFNVRPPQYVEKMISIAKLIPVKDRQRYYRLLLPIDDRLVEEYLCDCLLNNENFVDTLVGNFYYCADGLRNNPLVIRAVCFSRKFSDAKDGSAYIPPDKGFTLQKLYTPPWQALKSIKNPGAKQIFSEICSGNDPDIRLLAAFTLGRFDKQAATAVFLPYLKSDSPARRAMAIRGLASLGDKRALPHLLNLINNPHISEFDLRECADAMSDCGESAVPALLEALKIYERRENSPLAGEYGEEDPFRAEQISLLCALGEMRNAPATAALLTLAKSDNVLHSTGAFYYLKKNKYPRLYDVLIAALRHPEPEVCREAALKLGELGDRRALPALRGAMRRSDCKTAALRARIELKDTGAVEEALRLFDTGTPDEDIITALGKSHDPRAVEPLIALFQRARRQRRPQLELYTQNIAAFRYLSFAGELDDESFSALIRALGELGDKRAVEPLLQGINYEMRINKKLNYYIAALGALRDPLGAPPIMEALIQRPELGAPALAALAKIGDGAVLPKLLRKMHQGYGPTMSIDYESSQYYAPLGEFRDEASGKALRDALADPCWQVRTLAAGALGFRGDAAFVPDLLPLLADPQPQIRQAAAQSLGLLKAKEARAGLAALLQDNYSEIRATAKKALAGVGEKSEQ